MKFRYLVPLISFLMPTIFSSAFMMPKDTKLIIGFTMCLFFMTLTYLIGIQKVIGDLAQ